MTFDQFAPRTKLRAHRVREGDYLRIDADRWVLVKAVDLEWPDAAIELEGNLAITFPKDAEVEVSRRTTWAEVEGRYRVIDCFPYLDREEEYSDLSLEEAAARMEDLTGVGADVILSDFDEDCGACDGIAERPAALGGVWECPTCHGTGKRSDPWEWTDEETGREVSLVPEVEPEPNRDAPPEAGDMSRSDGLGA